MELLAQALDVRVDRAQVAARSAVAPDLLDEFLTGEDSSGAARELEEKVKLLGREMDLVAQDPRGPAGQVDLKARVGQVLLLRGGLLGKDGSA